MGIQQMIGAAAVISLAFQTVGCAVKTVEGAKARAMSLSELAGDKASEMKEWAEGKRENFVVWIKKGETVKLKLEGDAGFAKIETKEDSVRFLEDVYLCIDRKNGFLISPDGVRFAPIQRGKAVKKLFGKRRGTFQLGLGVTEEEGPVIHLSAGWK